MKQVSPTLMDSIEKEKPFDTKRIAKIKLNPEAAQSSSKDLSKIATPRLNIQAPQHKRVPSDQIKVANFQTNTKLKIIQK